MRQRGGSSAVRGSWASTENNPRTQLTMLQVQGMAGVVVDTKSNRSEFSSNRQIQVDHGCDPDGLFVFVRRP